MPCWPPESLICSLSLQQLAEQRYAQASVLSGDRCSTCSAVIDARLLGAWLELSAPPHCCNMYFMAEGQPLSSTARVSAAGNQAPHRGRTRHPALAFLMPLRKKREPQAALPRSFNSEGMSTALPRCSPLRGQCPLQLGVRLHRGDSHRARPCDLLLEVIANSTATLAPLLLSPL